MYTCIVFIKLKSIYEKSSVQKKKKKLVLITNGYSELIL